MASVAKSQAEIRQRASNFKTDDISVIKTVKGPNGSDLKIFDMQYYENELDIFESFIEGTLMLDTIKITREFVKCQDRVQNEGEQFCYLTTMRDTRF